MRFRSGAVGRPLFAGNRLDNRGRDRGLGRGNYRDPGPGLRVEDLLDRLRCVPQGQARTDARRGQSVYCYIARLRGTVLRTVAGIPRRGVDAVLIVGAEEP